ncbi:MAG: hypothetical protein Fur0039_23670 [Rhodocyclaceae bacterium]
MFRILRVERLIREAASLLVHFAHGGLLAGGLLASILIAAHFSGAIRLDLARNAAQSVLAAAAGQSVEATRQGSGFEDRPAAGEEKAEPGSAARSGIVDYLSRRYRVAGVAIEPLVEAAHQAGSRVGVDPLLIVAVMAIESGFNPFAESPVGARGLMQVVPRFHQDKLEGADERAFLDPLTNILVGARVLKESIQRAGGVEAGLQQYAGASGDADNRYASRVIAERQRLERAMRKGDRA